MQPQVNVCPEFWKDVKELRKKISPQQGNCILSPDDFKEASDLDRITSIPIINAIINYINNAFNDDLIDSETTKNGVQPFLANGWTIRKFRYGIDKTGKRGGLRVVFCINRESIVTVYIARKKDGEDEAFMQKECIARFKCYISA